VKFKCISILRIGVGKKLCIATFEGDGVEVQVKIRVKVGDEPKFKRGKWYSLSEENLLDTADTRLLYGTDVLHANDPPPKSPPMGG
jgi:hypothetical protein